MSGRRESVMKVTILQTDIVWANSKENQHNAEMLMDVHAGSDLYVLPEMFSTGFATEPEGVAEADDCSLKWMQSQSVERKCAIAGSIAVKEDGRFFNRFYFVFPDGSEFHYDKRHLFSYGGEDVSFTAGNERVVVEYKDFRILLQVCYDLRFPVFSRNHKDYDLAIYVANWPSVRLEAWSTLLHARAIENQCYVIGVNRVGKDSACDYVGGSEVVGPYGKTMVACEPGKVSAATVELKIRPLRGFRKSFPVLDDADLG